jgi:hypothetical protein
MEAEQRDPTGRSQPIKVMVDQRSFEDITSVIVEEGVLTLCDREGWKISIAPGGWGQAERAEERPLPDVPWGNPGNL